MAAWICVQMSQVGIRAPRSMRSGYMMGLVGDTGAGLVADVLRPGEGGYGGGCDGGWQEPCLS